MGDLPHQDHHQGYPLLNDLVSDYGETCILSDDDGRYIHSAYRLHGDIYIQPIGFMMMGDIDICILRMMMGDIDIDRTLKVPTCHTFRGSLKVSTCHTLKGCMHSAYRLHDDGRWEIYASLRMMMGDGR